MTVMRTYAISAPGYRVVQWLAEVGLMQDATHKLVVIAPACLILCESGCEQVRAKIGLAVKAMTPWARVSTSRRWW